MRLNEVAGQGAGRAPRKLLAKFGAESSKDEGGKERSRDAAAGTTLLLLLLGGKGG